MYVPCQRGFRQTHYLDQIASSDFWKSKADFDQALAVCYAAISRIYMVYIRRL